MPMPTRDQLVAEARSVPDLIARAKQADPALAQQLTEKPLLASKTVWGSAATMAVSWAATKWGLGWDPETCALVSGVAVLAVTAALRVVTASPIGGILRTKTPT